MSGSLGTQPATYSVPFDFRISQSPPAVTNIAEANLAIVEIYAFMQQTIRAFIDLCGIGPQVASQLPSLAGNSKTLTSSNARRFYVTAAEAITFGAVISLVNVAGTIQVRNANAVNNTRIADGFCSTPTGIAAGVIGEVILGSGIAAIGGLTAGQRYWLSTINGLASNVPAVAAGNVEQLLGVGIDATHLWFNSGMWLQH